MARMRSDGCIMLIIVLGVVIAPIVAIVSSSRQQRKAAEERRHLYDTQQRARGGAITRIVEQIASDPGSVAVQQYVRRLVEESPVGFHSALVADGGWFDHASPHLTTLLRDETLAHVVEYYFQLFQFPAGTQTKVLSFLHQALRSSEDNEQSVARFQRLAEPVLALSSVPESQWLYARALELVRERRGNPSSKALALFVGRRSYSAGRPDRSPTVYDEQAIANDIATRIT